MKGSSRLFALGFRPFYSLAAIFALASVLFWLLSFTGAFHVGGYLQGIFWHSHEMVFGFAIAVMSGFLFTAVRNWTGLPTPTGFALAALAALWIAGRVLIITGPPLPAALVDAVFVPALALAVAVPIVKSRNQRNYKIVALLLLIGITNVVYHLATLGFVPASMANTSLIAALDLITIVFAIVAGRVIPAFTKNAIPGSDPRHANWLEILSFGSLVLIVVLQLSNDWVSIPVLITTTIFLVAALAHSYRLALWQPHLTAGNPLLWMMPVAYSWLPIAFFLRALAENSLVEPGRVGSCPDHGRDQRAHARDDDAQRVGAHGSTPCGQWAGYVGLPHGSAGRDYSCDSRAVCYQSLPGAGHFLRGPMDAGVWHLLAALFADVRPASRRRSARLTAGSPARMVSKCGVRDYDGATDTLTNGSQICPVQTLH